MIGKTHTVAFLLAFVVSTVLTPVIRRFAIRKKLFDMPDGKRKVHVRPIPRLGGLAIIAGFYTPMVGALIYHNKLSNAITKHTNQVIGLFIGGLLVTIIGLYDDLKGADALKKLTVQILIGVVSYYLGYKISHINIPGYGMVQFWPWLSLVITVFWFVALMNAMNLVDGLDGLASGVSFFVLLSLGILAVLDHASVLLLFIAAIAGAVAGFWPHNKAPATIFMGDTGSLFIGFVLAAISIRTASKGSTLIVMFIPLIAMGLPLFDTSLAIIRRILLHRPIMQADQQHIHHKLLAAGLNPQSAVFILYVVTILLGVIAILLRVGGKLEVYLALLSLAAVIVSFVKFGGIGEILARKRHPHQAINMDVITQLIRDITRAYAENQARDAQKQLQALAEELGHCEIKLLRGNDEWAKGSNIKSTSNLITTMYTLDGGSGMLEFSCKRGDFDTTVQKAAIAGILARELERG